ncbi:MAG: VOC family protein [Ignavibacteriae bacterium]|nr:VOC family protein [Ignavibacteriota bacterium]
MSILGIHHITAICSNAQRTVNFYTKILGLRFVKKTVNFDDPGAYHLYFGDEDATPGTLLTFFEWSYLPKGNWGIGTTHHLALCVGTQEAQLKWKRWLIEHGVPVSGPYNRTYFHSIYFTDPDGLILEIATRIPGFTVDESSEELGTHQINPPMERTRFGRNEEEIFQLTWDESVPEISNEMKLTGLHHITAIASNIETTTQLYTETLGMRLVQRTVNYDDTTSPHYYYGVGNGAPGTIITYFGYSAEKMRYGKLGTGMTHHFAFAVENEEEQLLWRVKLMKAGLHVSPVMNRVYFKSIYFSDPDGHILEIATLKPGFTIDESKEELGTNLKLPPWYESRRKEIEETLPPLMY